MADSTALDVTKMKVVELRKELKTRGLPNTGDKSELVARLQAAVVEDEQHADINLDSDEIDSDGVLEDEYDKGQNDILEDSTVDTLNEELALSEQPSPPKPPVTKPARTLKRKVPEANEDKAKEKPEQHKEGTKKIVLNRNVSITSEAPVEEEKKEQSDSCAVETKKIKITADIDAKTRLEMRAKRFGLPIQISDDARKEARKQRFGQVATSALGTASTLPVSGTLSENIDKLKKRSERFGQSVSKIMSDIEAKEKLEKRKAKFGTVK